MSSVNTSPATAFRTSCIASLALEPRPNCFSPDSERRMGDRPCELHHDTILCSCEKELQLFMSLRQGRRGQLLCDRSWRGWEGAG